MPSRSSSPPLSLPPPGPSPKMARVAELERARDDLTARVDAAIASEKGAGERVSALEEEAADAKALATDAGWVGVMERSGT